MANAKLIIWNERDGVMQGYVGGTLFFSYWYNDKARNDLEKFTLRTNLYRNYPNKNFATRAECESTAVSMLQRFINTIAE